MRKTNGLGLSRWLITGVVVALIGCGSGSDGSGEGSDEENSDQSGDSSGDGESEGDTKAADDDGSSEEGEGSDGVSDPAGDDSGDSGDSSDSDSDSGDGGDSSDSSDSGDGGESDDAATIQTLCAADCDEIPDEIEGCPPATDIGTLRMLCKGLCSGFLDTGDCRDQWRVYSSCLKTGQYECAEGSTFPTPSNAEDCEDEATPFVFGEANGVCVDTSAMGG